MNPVVARLPLRSDDPSEFGSMSLSHFRRSGNAFPMAKLTRGNIVCQIVRCSIFRSQDRRTIDNIPRHD